ncbi:MAG TPA: glycosyltransferase [Verrucomicrobiae bacterium]
MYGTSSITAAICTHNPDRAVFQRCLAALRAQQHVPVQTDLLVIDNGSQPPLAELPGGGDFPGFSSVRIVREDRLGLTHARERALREARSEVVVFVDDDNFLRPDHLAVAADFFSRHPKAGAAGGKCRGKCETTPPAWFESIAGYLAVTDDGEKRFHVAEPSWWAPVGAGMAVRRAVALEAFTKPMLLTDRRGKSLSSGGDTEICYRICRSGHQLWYLPELVLDHYMPAWRYDPAYLLRLAKGIGESQAILDLYRMPDDRRSRLLVLRRAIYFGRQGLALKRKAARDTDERTRLASQMRCVQFLTQSRAMFSLCFNLPKL